jgi:hypothetical protein
VRQELKPIITPVVGPFLDPNASRLREDEMRVVGCDWGCNQREPVETVPTDSVLGLFLFHHLAIRPKVLLTASVIIWMVALVFGSIFATPSLAAERQVLHGHVPAAVTKLNLQLVGRLPATTNLNLAIGLPLRNREVLTKLLQQIYDLRSPNYRHYLTPAQFTEMFGPTEQDYQTLIAFAKANGLTVIGTHPNRTLVDVKATVADIERVFNLTMRVYQHPTEARTFYAPDVEPSVDLAIPVLAIDGLDNFIIPRPMGFQRVRSGQATNAITANGSAPDGVSYMGDDFRAAYVPSTSLTGSGQAVGLLELDGYYATDIATYEHEAGLLPVPLTNVLVSQFSGNPDGNARNVGEVSLDIEMAISMAPGLDKVIVYEATDDLAFVNDVLNRMATDNLARQLSCSWDIGDNPSRDQIYQQYAAQGAVVFPGIR